MITSGLTIRTLFKASNALARQGISLTINALSTLLFLFTIILVIGYYFITQRNSKAHRMGGKE